MLKKSITKVSSFRKSIWFFPVIVTAAYLLVNVILLHYHEPWRDEAQAWLIAKDLPFWDMISQLKYEGHPVLWYVLLFPFAHLGMPYASVGAISLAIMTVSVLLFSRYAPLAKTPRVIIVFSSLFIYFYPVISRSYVLIVLLGIIVCIFYRHRLKRPVLYASILALLLQTHVWVAGFVAALFILFAYDMWAVKKNIGSIFQQKQMLISLAIPLVSLLLIGITLGGGDSTGFGFKALSASEAAAKSVEFITQSIQVPFSIPDLAFILGLIFCIVLFIYFPRILFVFLSSLSIPLFITVFMYGVNMQRALVIFAFIVFCLWLAIEDGNQKKSRAKVIDLISPAHILTGVVLLLSLLSVQCYLSAATNDLEHNYSSGKALGSFIYSHLPNDAVLIVTGKHDFSIAAIKPYTKNSQLFYSTEYGGFVTYKKWNQKTPLAKKSQRQQIDILRHEHPNVYLVALDESPINDQQIKLESSYRALSPKFLYSSDEGYDSGAIYSIK